MDVSVGGDCFQYVEVAGRQAGEAEKRDARRQVEEIWLRFDARWCRVEALRRAGDAETTA